MEINKDNWSSLRQHINRKDQIKTPLNMVRKTKNNILIIKKFKKPTMFYAFPVPKWFDIDSLQYFEDTSNKQNIVDILAHDLIYMPVNPPFQTLSNGKFIKNYHKFHNKNIEEISDQGIEDHLLKEMI